MAHTWKPFMLIRSHPLEGLRVDYPPLFARRPPEQVIEALEFAAAHLWQEAAEMRAELAAGRPVVLDPADEPPKRGH